MAIRTLDQLINGLIPYAWPFAKDASTNKQAGLPHSSWYLTGGTGLGAAPTGALNGNTFTAPVNGAIAMPPALAGAFSRLAKLSVVHTGGIGAAWLVDRIWGNVPVVTTTTSQAIVSPTWPARDNSGSTNGAGVLVALECSASTGNLATIANTTMSYTNSAGTAGRSATLSLWPIGANTVGSFLPFSLQAGDVGVRSIQSVTLGTSYVSGAIHMIAYRLIASMPVPTANLGNDRGPTNLGLPIVYDSSVLQVVYFPTGTSIPNVYGDLWFAQG